MHPRLSWCALLAAALLAACDSPVTGPSLLPAAPNPPAAAAQSAFPIEMRFVGDVPDDVKNAALAAAARWMRVVTGPVAPMLASQAAGHCSFAPALSETVPGVVVFVRMSSPDSLAEAGAAGGACATRPGTLVSYEGAITVSTPGLANSRAANYLGTIFLHELGHVLGIGTNWFRSPYLVDASGPNPGFAGPNAMRAAYDVGASATPTTPVQVSHAGESGAYTHWRSVVLVNDIMLSGGGTALTAVSAGALQDMGYVISRSALDPYLSH